MKQIGIKDLQLNNIKFREHTTYIMYLLGSAVSDPFEQKMSELTAWTNFEGALLASRVWQEIPDHTHFLDTF